VSHEAEKMHESERRKKDQFVSDVGLTYFRLMLNCFAVFGCYVSLEYHYGCRHNAVKLETWTLQSQRFERQFQCFECHRRPPSHSHAA
jgi:hypothetical protein